MKKFGIGLLFALVLLCCSGCGNRTMLEIPENQPQVETRPDLSYFASADMTDVQLKMVMNQNLKYLLNTWWNAQKPEALINQTGIATDTLSNEEQSFIRKSQKSFAKWQKEERLFLAINDDRPYTENSIRPLSHVCDIVMTALVGGYYDEEIVGISQEDAKAMTMKLMSAAAATYVEDKWGKTWQSALWAENIGYAAWLIWDDLSQEDQRNITYMILTEADNILHMDILYYRDREGNEIRIGDTKGEEIAWNTKILALAMCMFPNHENVHLWQEKLVQMLIAATARPEDLVRVDAVDGVIPAEFLDGTNVNSDGTVINHGLCHIDYMTTIVEEMTETMILFRLAGREPLQSALYNVDLIFNALVNVDLGIYDESKTGTYFYQRDEEGNVTGATDMPGVNDWGGHWYANYYLTDVYAGLFGMDRDVEARYKADQWAGLHLDVAAGMVARNEAGNFFLPGENNFVSGEMFQMHNLVRAYTLQRLFIQ